MSLYPDMVELRSRPQINWSTPYQWQQKMSHEEVASWFELARQSATEASLQEASEGSPLEALVRARIRSLMDILEIEYIKCRFI